MKPIPEILKLVKLSGGDVDNRLGPPTMEGCAFRLGSMVVIVSNGEGWDHVSASCKSRLPRYEEMKQLRRICFEKDEWAVEYHAPPTKHINTHPNCLHLWRPQESDLPVPPQWMV